MEIKTTCDVIEDVEKFMDVRFYDLTWMENSKEDEYMNKQWVSVDDLKIVLDSMDMTLEDLGILKMKTLNVPLEDAEFEILKKQKGKKSRHDFIMEMKQ